MPAPAAPAPAAPKSTPSPAPLNDSAYQYHPEKESVDQYFSRVQDYNASKGDFQPAGRSDLRSFKPAPPPAPKYGSVSPSESKQPAQEPAVVSSSSIDNVIADNKTALASLSKKGTTMDANGNMLYADGSIVPPPDANESPENDPALKSIKDSLDALRTSSDAATKSHIDVIHQQFDSYRKQVEDQNQQSQDLRSRALLMGGASRYAPMDESSVMNAEVKTGLDKIQQLDAQENAAIAQAQSAQSANDFKLTDQWIAAVQDARKEKMSAAADLTKKMQDIAQKQRDNAIQATRDDSVASLVQQGISDPKQILDYLNHDQSGNETGDFTAEEVAKTLKNIAASNGVDTSKTLTGDVKNFMGLKQSGQLPEGLSSLPEDEQLAAYIKMVHQATKSGSGDFTLGSNSTRFDANGHVIATGSKVGASGPAKPANVSKEIDTAGRFLEVGVPGKGYNGRGADGFTDPNLYVALYNAAGTQYGPEGQAMFLKKFPPHKNINPANIGNGSLPQQIQNAVLAGQKVKKVGIQ